MKYSTQAHKTINIKGAAPASSHTNQHGQHSQTGQHEWLCTFQQSIQAEVMQQLQRIPVSFISPEIKSLSMAQLLKTLNYSGDSLSNHLTLIKDWNKFERRLNAKITNVDLLLVCHFIILYVLI